ncbi:GPP34 family phosphoprotein [Streptomyces sp. A0642]|uniref:GPP34 family phosphoprotein n=1 Tax=Streptomyces sp. A0642 TaxID=2563100 RepID=UPI0010A2794E|nr:GPP34 family phosphoprotein [Streptomyces sp. A0642]THA76060.1 GPP34 family phosphoprotein [Streptomyces sp. A0642]
MTTARDLALVVLGRTAGPAVGRGDLALALAGAEAVDLLTCGALTLEGDSMVPGPRMATGDRLLDRALDSLDRSEPHETVGDWLWRRGGALASAYAEDLEEAGLLASPRGHGWHPRPDRSAPADSPEWRAAEERVASGEPVLAALTTVLGAGEAPADAGESLGDAVVTVLAAVGDAVTELEAVRLRRDVEGSAFDNIWRG